jgi:trk system potassium uptake protein TrkA
MGKKLDVGVIGLGKFGLTLAQALAERGHKVVGVDASPAQVRLAKDTLFQVYEADATDKAVLEQLRFQDLDRVIVSIGQSMEASILISLNLQEIEAKEVWVKAVSVEHHKVLIRLGVDYVVLPEHYVAQQLAHRFSTPGMMDFLPLGEGALLQEVAVDAWAGRTLRELNLPGKHQVQVVALKTEGAKEFTFVPRADYSLAKGDKLVIIGRADNVLGLDS